MAVSLTSLGDIMKHARARSGHFRLSTAAFAVAMLGGAGLIWDASYAAFSATTTNGSNTWSTGSVSITNDQSGAAVFSLSSVAPDASATILTPPASGAFNGSSAASGGSACIKVTYTGTMAANVRLYATLNNTGADGGLGQYLLFDIDNGTGPGAGADVGCASYSSTGYLHGSASNSNVYLNSMPTTYAGGYAWNGATQNSTRWYRLSWLLPSNVNTAAQSESVQATFTWEAQNT